MLFFKKKPEADQDDFIHEKWTARFRKEADRRFLPENGEGYTSEYSENEFVLKLDRSNFFAWSPNPWYQYGDFNLEADCSFGAENGYSSMGFCFRRINDLNYYYFLLSSKGYYRFDVVFNGTPQIIIPWTLFTDSDEVSDIHLRIVARGGRFIFLIGEEWIGEADDESIASGRFAWAGQNYDEKPDASFILRGISIDSRPIDVEAAYSRWGDYVPVDPDLRTKLAESFYLLGAYAPALVQLKKARHSRALTADENIIAAKSFLGSGMYEEALMTGRKCCKNEPENVEALQVIGTALYTLNRFLELKDFLKARTALLEKENWYWGLAGNCEYGLGNWEKAGGFYRKALEHFPEEPLFLENLTRAMEKSGKSVNAAGVLKDGEEKKVTGMDIDSSGCSVPEAELISSYEEAARMYFRAGEYDQVAPLIKRIRKSDPGNRTAAELDGKILFHQEEWDRAMEFFAPIAESGETDDSSVYFLYGLLLGFHDLREQAGRYLEKAAGMEPESFIYQFKAAESRHLGGEEMEPFLSRGLELEPDDIWINNLAGLNALEAGEPGDALEFLEKGWTIFRKNQGKDADDSGWTDLLINYSQALFDSGRTGDAMEVLDGHKAPEIYNHRGNLLSSLGDYQSAVDYYEKAVASDRNSRVYMLNCASACIESDFVHRAEELLQLLDDEDPEVLNLLGNLASIKGEFTRAEAAYREAMRLDPGNRLFVVNLAELLSRRGDNRHALELLEGIPESGLSRRGRRLLSRIREETGK